MKRFWLVLHVAVMVTSVAFLLGAARAAQTGLPAPSFDPALWVAEAGALAAIVFALVGFLKKRIAALKGELVVATSFGVAILISIGLQVFGYMNDTILAAVLHGVSAGLLASGGWDGIRAAFGAGSGGTAETPASGASLPR